MITALCQYFSVFGISETQATDEAAFFTSAEMRHFCETWGIRQRLSSAYYPRSNKRAEIGVKSAKWLVLDKITSTGDLDNNKICRALLLHRNSPDPSTKVSPAEIVFVTRNSLPKANYRPREPWSSLASKREALLLHRHFKKVESLDFGARKLQPLQVQDHVYIQYQSGNKPLQWDKSEVIIEVLPFDSYLVRVDESRKITKRNRKFLRCFEPFLPKPKDKPSYQK